MNHFNTIFSKIIPIAGKRRISILISCKFYLSQPLANWNEYLVWMRACARICKWISRRIICAMHSLCEKWWHRALDVPTYSLLLFARTSSTGQSNGTRAVAFGILFEYIAFTAHWLLLFIKSYKSKCCKSMLSNYLYVLNVRMFIKYIASIRFQCIVFCFCFFITQTSIDFDNCLSS